jgi:LPXTG-motif cell wall-anchored protein
VSTPLRQVPEPPQADAVLPVTIGTVLWGLAFLVLLPFRSRLAESGDDWWLWVALVGFLLGVLGTWWVRRRRALYERAGRSAAGQS